MKKEYNPKKYIYLMIKTHKVTGKKYLCKRETNTDKSAIKYKGSGLRWLRHLKIHGKDLDTEILYKCLYEDKNIFNTIAMVYSNKLNILDNQEWMNLVVEQGQGGSQKETNGTRGKKWIYKDNKRTLVIIDKLDEYVKNGWTIGFPPEFRKLISEQLKGKPSPNKGKRMKLPHEYTSKKNKNYYFKRPPYTSEMRSIILKECLNRPEVLEKFKKPRKPLITAQNIKSEEIKTMGRHAWWNFAQVNYKRLLKGGTSKGWKLVLVEGYDPSTSPL